ncbi:MAG: acetate--CoA ligase [Deltaproteobacteria bacterium]|nr:acetate--CoA ligase [Deltaproteobacteria bacterium]
MSGLSLSPAAARSPFAGSAAAIFWEEARNALPGLPGGGLNIAWEAVDRHVLDGRGQAVALRWLGEADSCRDFTYLELAKLSGQFAQVLQQLEVGSGERVFTLLGRVPELYITALGTLKQGAVFSPLFAVFGPEPIRLRLTAGKARVLVTTQRLYEDKIKPLRKLLPELKQVLLVDKESPAADNFWQRLNYAGAQSFLPATRAESPALLHFTSGTTGRAKGVLHRHGAVVAHYATAQKALALRSGDIFWCTADPGWVTGTSYGIIAPLVIGATLLVESQEFEPQRWCRILQDYRVNVWYTAPTALRMMMRLGSEFFKAYDFSSLHFAASVGEPLNAELVLWGREIFGCPLHDSWWQTETGAIMIANYVGIAVKPGAMGKALPGIECAVVKRMAEDRLEMIATPETVGELALRAGWPSMFVAYIDDEKRYRRCFIDGWYLSGDLVRRDADGYFWFVGRRDDAIKSAGHLIGPYEVERVLLAHPAVADVGVIGIPDPLLYESVRACVVLKVGFCASEQLKRELKAWARRVLGPAVAPREVEFFERLPKTRSGKIMRRVLRARVLGEAVGDLSTLDENL